MKETPLKVMAREYAAARVAPPLNDNDRAELAEREDRNARGHAFRIADVQEVIDRLVIERDALIVLGEKLIFAGESEREKFDAVIAQYNLVLAKILFCQGLKTKIESESLDEFRDINLERADR